MRSLDKHGFGVSLRTFGILVILFSIYIFVVHVFVPLTYTGVTVGVIKDVKHFTVHKYTSAREVTSVDVDVSKMNIAYSVGGKTYTVDYVAEGTYSKGDTFEVRYKSEDPSRHTFDRVEIGVFALCVGIGIVSLLVSEALFISCSKNILFKCGGTTNEN